MEKTEEITVQSLPRAMTAVHPLHQRKNLTQKIKDFEKYVIMDSLQTHGSTVAGKARAAEELGISLPTLYRKLQAL